MDGVAGLGKQLLNGLKWAGVGLAGLVLSLAAWIGIYQFSEETQGPVVAVVPTATSTFTSTPTDTPTITPTPTATFTPTPTTSTPTPVPTNTPIPTDTPTATPSPPPTATPVPVAADATPYASGGLGLARATWNATHTSTGPGTTLGDLPANIYDSLYAVLFVDERVAWIDRSWSVDDGVTLPDAEAAAGNLMPSDRLFIRVYYPPELAGAAVNVYFSPSLAARFPAETWIGDAPGTFAAVFEHSGDQGSGPIRRMIIMLNDPVSVLQNFPVATPVP